MHSINRLKLLEATEKIGCARDILLDVKTEVSEPTIARLIESYYKAAYNIEASIIRLVQMDKEAELKKEKESGLRAL